MDFLNKVLEFVLSAGGMAATVAVVLDFVLRLIPSEKPLSILRMVAALVRKLGEVCLAVADLSDKVLPQKLK